MNLAARMARVFKSGLMALSMKVTGELTRRWVEVALFTQMVTSIMASGKMTKHTDLEIIITQMALATKDTGLRISSMVMARKSGLTMPAMRASTATVRSTEEVNSSGLMVPLTPANSRRTTSMVTVFTLGPMVDNTTDSGRTTRWMVQVYLHGPMEESMKVNTWMIKRRVMECLPGLMVVSTTVTGRMESSMVRASTTQAAVKSREANGMRANASGGSIRPLKSEQNLLV